MVKIVYKDPAQYRSPPDSLGLSKLQKDLLKRRLPLLLTDDERFLFCKLNLTDVRDLAKNDFQDSNKLLELIKGMKLTDHICIVSDFDTDGISSAVVIEKSLHILGYTNVDTVINKRIHGTGVTNYCLDKIFTLNNIKPIDYIILSDHGSKNEKEYQLIKSKIPNVKIILTDHHTVDMSCYPYSVDAFISAERLNKVSPLSKISGCAVAYLTMLLIAKDKYQELEPLLYLVGLSTISDVMPLDNYVNRYFVKVGINHMYTMWPKIVKEVLKTDKITTTDLSFKVIPVINTGNRMDCEYLSYGYINNEDFAISELSTRNIARKMETNRLCKEIKNNEHLFKDKNSIVCKVRSEHALGGNVASRIGELYNKPTVIFTKDNTVQATIAGSIRGIIPTLNVVQVLQDIDANHPGILVRYGGHRGAAGCSINYDKFDTFVDLFEKYTSEQLKHVDITKTIYVDMNLSDKELHPGLLKTLELLEPFGHNWEPPVFCTPLKLITAIPVGDNCKLVFKTTSNYTIEGYYHCSKESLEDLIGEMVSVYYSIDTYTPSIACVLSLSVLAIEEIRR